ncbi:MAG TPA: ABC transporter permease [Gemmatimonadales bacterium]|nr:ABC transporter permease [Gemmatimonadales bacterium]
MTRRLGPTLLFALAAVAVFGPFLLHDPNAQPDPFHLALLPPGPGHWLGTDQLSRDVLARVVAGARISLSIAGLAVLVSLTVGSAVGLSAGFVGGATDHLLMRGVDGALAVPRLFYLMLAAAAWDRMPLSAFILILGLTGWFATSRLVRGEVLRLRREPFVEAAQALGASPARVILRHLLPNAAGPLLVTATLAVGDVILLEAGLSFLGIGVRPPTPSWGGMILEGKDVLAAAPWVSIAPGVAIAATVLAIHLTGESVRHRLDPRSR